MLLTCNFFYMTSPEDLTPWALHVIFMQLSSICGIQLIKYLFTILPKAQLFQSAKDP